MPGPLGLGITEGEAFDPTLTWVSVEEALRHPQAPHAAEGWLRKFARAVEQTTDGVCITGSTGIIEYVNPAFEALTGYPRQVLVGQSTRLLRSDAHDSAFYQRLWQTVLAGRVFRDVFLDRNAAGQHLHLDQTITPVRDARGRVTHFVVVARDVSARMRTENALRRLTESLEQQAKWIAQTLHDEAGQYLTAAHLALADAEAGLDPAGRDRLQAARLHLERVEEELRRLAHEVHPRILDDIGLTGAIEQLASGMERRRGIPVRVQVLQPRPLPAVVQTAVYRVVQEALTNAGKHSRAFAVSVRLEQDCARVQCTVTDDGVGFDTADALAPRGRAGLGLGLRGIQDRVEALQGGLRVTSAPGCGTEIAVWIPLEQA